MVEQVVKTYGRIDILVNVAGILRDRMIFNMAKEEWDAVLAVHLDGTYFCTRAAASHMREQKDGRIISMSSVSALGSPGQPNYGAAKAGIIGLYLVHRQRHGQVQRDVERDHAERGHPHDRLHAAWHARSSSRPASGRASRPSAPSAIRTTWRRSWSTWRARARGHVNGQVFHSFGYGYTLMAQPRADPPHRRRPQARARGAGQALPGHPRQGPPRAARHQLRQEPQRAAQGGVEGDREGRALLAVAPGGAVRTVLLV